MTSPENSLSRWQVLNIAWPIILSNLSTPLLGLVDTAVIGNWGEASLIGAIALGGIIFSFLYWGFGFLRMGTTALVAQAIGAQRPVQSRASFYRAFILGSLIGCLLLILQSPILDFALSLLDGSREVESSARRYFEIRIWVAPISLAHLAIMGLLLGHGETKLLLLLQLILNCTNIVLDIIFVVFLQMGVEGVALATVIAEVLAFCAGLIIVHQKLKAHDVTLNVPLAILFDKKALKVMFLINRDIMIRTLCLIFAFAWFANQGAQAGDVTLAANAILMQFVSFAAFFLDGFALAAETLVGRAIGAKNVQFLNKAISYSSQLGVITALLIGVIFFFTGDLMINVITNIEEVRQVASSYLLWVIVTPAVSVACYLLDGIFIGATRTQEMRNAMIASLVAFLLAWYFFHPWWGNHGLWLSLEVYFIARGVTLAFYFPKIKQAMSHSA
jgi:multidrug resistance protein, MATE family